MEQLKITDGVRRDADENMVRFYFEQSEKELQSLYDISYKTTTIGFLVLSGIITLMGIFACLITKGLDIRITITMISAISSFLY
jgi:hypothetical protein